MGGHVKNPGYREVVGGRTGHLEAVEVIYDKNKVSYEMLAKTFLRYTTQPKKMDKVQILAHNISLQSLLVVKMKKTLLKN